MILLDSEARRVIPYSGQRGERQGAIVLRRAEVSQAFDVDRCDIGNP